MARVLCSRTSTLQPIYVPNALQGITMCDNGPHEMGSPGIGSREHHDDVIG